MSESQKETAAPAKTFDKVCGSLLDTVVSVGSSWAAYGLKVGKLALQTSAETLGKTATTLDTLATEFEKKAPKAEPPKTEEAPSPAA